MDKNAIRKYAIFAREELIKRVSIKAEEYGVSADVSADPNLSTIGDRVLTTEEKRQRTALVNAIKNKGHEHVIEEIAYTWFNRFIALRFMEVNGYLPSKVRVFTNENNEFKPQILDEALHIELTGLNLEKVMQLKEQNKTDELYKYLLITQCNALHTALPKMFQELGDFTELLFPSNILSDDSIIGKLIAEIKETDFTEEVEILGWLYQFYNSEEKSKVIDIIKATAIKKEDIPVATQLFTTDWVVRYMVENSLGKYWIERNPNSTIADKLQYFVTPKDGKINYLNETISPEEITFFEPCMGSGHVLVYAFNIFMEIYKEAGYSERDAASLIIEKNLFGLDIDQRAYQLSYFALKMKARSFDRRFLTRGIEPQVYAPILDEELKHFGSMYIVEELGDKPTEPEFVDLFNHNWEEKLNDWNFKNLLCKKYSVVCTNPPYLNKYNPELKKYVTTHYKDYGTDLFSVFIYKNFDYCVENGYSAFMTPNVWMFIKSYEKLRKYILNNKSISSLIQIAKGAFYKEATVDVMTFVLQNAKKNEKGLYLRLDDFKGDMEVQKQKVLEALANKECGYFYETSEENFSKIPGSPIAYWVSDKMLSVFDNQTIGEIAPPKVGLQTGENDRFLRCWWEVVLAKIKYNSMGLDEFVESACKWLPYNKGGERRQWYGNYDYVVNWENDGFEIKNFRDDKGKIRSRPQNTAYYLKSAITWSDITSGGFSIRYRMSGGIHDVTGMSAFCEDEMQLKYLLGLMSTKISDYIFKILNPTIHLQIGNFCNFPVLENTQKNEVVDISEQCIALSKNDWDSFETSWDFEKHPLVSYFVSKAMWGDIDPKELLRNGSIELSYKAWESACQIRFQKLKQNEEELNLSFIDIYGLQDELTPEVADKDVTVRLADKTRDVKSFISYAVGCMFGRYSLDVDGLVYAGGDINEKLEIYKGTYGDLSQSGMTYADLAKGKTYKEIGQSFYYPKDTGKKPFEHYGIDYDNIIPICDDEYFEDDIVGRLVSFVECVYGKDTLEENLDFIASALGGKGTSRQVIRTYFIKDFYADHCKTYQKRPIYWQFDSGKKNGFKALIYMHRYEADTMARMRTDYIHEQQGRYRTAMEDIDHRLINAETSEKVKLTKQLATLKDQDTELRLFEEKVHHLADQMIKIDLDDGVKNNYEIFKDVVTKIK